ncbi:MAG: AAA family ATPase, partial [Pseudonocardia sp.]|nr:AAA family ATPase [Pseudonocardia sp.]
VRNRSAAPVELFGRESELGVVRRRVDGMAGRRDAAWLVVCGEPGIGKTRLLAELAARADAAGHLVLTGRGVELERRVPFGVLVDALDSYLGAVERTRLRELRPEQLAELAAVFPALAPLRSSLVAAGPENSAPAERYLAHRAVRALLERLSRGRPLVLVLDDLHWGDPASVELICYLLRRPPQAPVLTALAARSATMPEPLAAAVAAAERDSAPGDDPNRLELGPLDAAGADALLRALGAGDPTTRAELYRDSGGNPFYLVQLARVRSDGLGGAGAPVGIPHVVAAAVAREIEDRSPAARRIAQAAAVTGDPFEPELVAATGEVALDDVFPALDELLDADLVRPTEVPRRFAFRHPIVRHAVYESCTAGWRLAAHARAAARLAATGAPAVVRAPHVERSAAGGDAAAAAVLAQAGRDSFARAPAEAAHWFRGALRLRPHGGDRIDLSVALGDALAAAGQLADAHTVLDDLLARPSVTDPALRGRLLASCVGLEHLLGAYGRARARLTSALDAIGDSRSAEAAAVKNSIAADCFYTGDFEQMRRWEHAAREDALALGNPTVLAVSTALVAAADYMAGDVAAARRATLDTVRLLDEVPDHRIAPYLVPLTWFGWAEAHLGHLDDALRHLDRFAAVARSNGTSHLVPLMDVGRAFALLWLGRLGDAEQAADAAVDASLFSGARLILTTALTVRSWASLLRGDVADAIRWGTDAVRNAGPDPDIASSVAYFWLAEARLEAGEPQRCRDDLLAAARGPELPVIERPLRPRWYEILTRAELACGSLDDAAVWAARAEEAAEGEERIGLRTCEAGRASAAVLLARGAAAAAADTAMTAADVADAEGAIVLAARARVLAGRAFAEAGADRDAVAVLQVAESALAGAGARRHRDEAARELRMLGRPVARGGRRRAPDPGTDPLDQLSGRERQVAELVAEGRTNRQIAAALYLSEKTVESHLARVFGKLGVRSRASVAARVTRASDQ